VFGDVTVYGAIVIGVLAVAAQITGSPQLLNLLGESSPIVGVASALGLGALTEYFGGAVLRCGARTDPGWFMARRCGSRSGELRPFRHWHDRVENSLTGAPLRVWSLSTSFAKRPLLR
jgi:hypothetical protein